MGKSECWKVVVRKHFLHCSVVAVLCSDRQLWATQPSRLFFQLSATAHPSSTQARSDLLSSG